MYINSEPWGFSSGSVVKNPLANAEDMCSNPDPGRSHMPRSNYAYAPHLLNLGSSAWELQVLKS